MLYVPLFIGYFGFTLHLPRLLYLGRKTYSLNYIRSRTTILSDTSSINSVTRQRAGEVVRTEQTYDQVSLVRIVTHLNPF